MLSLSEVARMVGGTLVGDGATHLASVGTDSRNAAQHSLFVALKGESFDGHGFAVQACRDGAAAALLDHAVEGIASAVVVSDTKLALGQLAAAWRARFTLPLIAVTGSNGKTTVTQMIAAILRAHVQEAAFATHGNLNNDIGVPLTLLRLRAAHKVGVVELGMNHPGEIATLANIARPTVAMVNNAQREHQEFMKSVAEVAAENGTVLIALPDDGIAVINADDEFASLWRGLAGSRKIISFGLNERADVRATYELGLFGAHLTLHTPHGDCRTELRIAGLHNVRNACAAAASAIAAGVPLAAIAQGLRDFVPVAGRLVKHVTANGAVVIDDTYNANPDSVRAAIDVLAQVDTQHGGTRVLVLGRMGEVGDQGPAFHHEVGAYAKARGIEHLLTFGAETRATVAGYGAGAQYFDDIEALNTTATQLAQPHTTLLIKGSRSARMERVVAHLLGAPTGTHH